MMSDRWWWKASRKELEREVDEEVAHHLEMRAEDLEREGRDRATALAEARSRFGDVDAYRQEMLAIRSAQVKRCERARLWEDIWEDIWQDIRFGVRQQLRRPALPLFIVALLVVGVGVTTAIFSIVKAVLLAPLPFPSPDRLVYLLEAREGYSRIPASYPNFKDWQSRNQSFEAVAGFTPWYFSVAGEQGAERVLGTLVTSGAFELLGVEPALGRTLSPEEDRPGADKVVLLSHGLWSRRYGADPEVIGTTIRLNGEQFTVIGVMPPGFQVPRSWLVGERSELWASLAAASAAQPILEARGAHWMAAVGRLKEGVSLTVARQEMNLLAESLAEAYPDTNEGAGVRVVSVSDELVGGVDRQLLMLLAGAGLLLLVVCANVAGLLMARATARQSELAVRSAIGAGPWRLIRQLLIENLPLCLLGGGLAFLLSRWGVSSLHAMLPSDIPRIDTVEVSWVFLLFALTVSLATGLIFSLAPAWILARAGGAGTLRGAQRAAGAGPGRQRLRSTLVVAQIAITLVLGNAAVLMLSSYTRLIDKDYGFDRENVLTLRVSPEGPQWQGQNEIRSFYEQVLDRVGLLPGVVSAAATSKLPLEGGSNSTLAAADGHDFESKKGPTVEISVVTNDYFQAMGIPLLAGRSFTEDDSGTATAFPAVINQTMAEALWPGEDAIGKSFSFETPHQWTVIGVVGTVPQLGAERRALAEAYVTFTAEPPNIVFSMSSIRYLVVECEVEPSSLAASIRKEVARVAPDQPVSDIRSTGRILAAALAQRRFQTLLVGLFASVVLFLMVSGVFGVMSFFVAERSSELGIRRALGASWETLCKVVMGQCARLVAAGVALGLLGIFASARLTRAMVYGISPTDPVILAASVLALVAIAFLGSLLPARRAAVVDPIVTLKQQ